MPLSRLRCPVLWSESTLPHDTLTTARFLVFVQVTPGLCVDCSSVCGRRDWQRKRFEGCSIPLLRYHRSFLTIQDWSAGLLPSYRNECSSAPRVNPTLPALRIMGHTIIKRSYVSASVRQQTARFCSRPFDSECLPLANVTHFIYRWDIFTVKRVLRVDFIEWSASSLWLQFHVVLLIGQVRIW